MQISYNNSVDKTTKTMLRNSSIDVAKGFGILLVVIGHLWDQLPFFDTVHNILYAFHMPLFFIISGMLFRSNSYSNFKQFITKRLKTLILPYIIFAILSWCWYFTVNIIWNKGLDTALLTNFAKSFGQIIYAQYSTKVLNTPLWFVLCLFAVEIIYFFISRLRNKYLFWFVVAVISLFGWFSESEICPIDFSVLPWNFSSACFSLGFYALGNTVKPILDKYLYGNNKHSPLLILYSSACICLVLSSVIGITNGYISIGSRALGNGWCIYLTGVIGTFGALILGVCWKNCKFLQFCGKNSFYIMATHVLFRDMIVFLYNFVLEIAKHFLNGISFYNIVFDYTNFLQCLIITVLIIIICCLFCTFYANIKTKITNKFTRTEGE